MEKRGQAYMLIGVVLNSTFLILSRFLKLEAGWIDFVYGMLIGLSLVFLIAGLVLTFRAKKKVK